MSKSFILNIFVHFLYATLLVAVVGATFAYFTATVQNDPEQQDTDRKTEVKTAVTASAVMTMGDAITTDENGVYPGFKAVRPLKIKGTCSAKSATCQPVDGRITITENIPEDFGEDVTWKLYKKNTAEVTCTASNVTQANGQYKDNVTCNTAGGTEVLSSSDETKYYDVEDIAAPSETDYYLVLEYADNEDQNDQMENAFSVSMSFGPIPGA